MDTNRIRAEIDLDAIEYNADAVLQRLPEGVKYMAVIKADGYGHGAVPIARLLRNKADYFAVATIDEGVELRKNGIRNPILVLGSFSSAYFAEAIRQRIQPVIFQESSAFALSREAVKLGMTAEFQLAVDTGMSRIGFAPTEESAEAIRRIVALPNLRLTGLFSHYATADESDKTEALRQREKYNYFLHLLRQKAVEPPLKHLCNSAGIMEFHDYDDMVREGIILYGLYPSKEVNREKFPIKPALSLISHVTNVQLLPAGRGISYGRTYITDRPTTVATIPVGYADGYPRCLSNRGQVLIHGEFCPILGRICMDQFMVDVSHLKNVKVDDRVTLVGADGENHITVEDVADNAYSFNYEFVCGISRRVPRVYFRHGEKLEEVSYLDIPEPRRLLHQEDTDEI